MREPGLRFIGGDKADPHHVPQTKFDFKTRGDLMATRRGCLMEDNELQRARGEEANITPRINESIRSAHVWDMNKTTYKKGTGVNGEGEKVLNQQRRTQSMLEADRKKERREYDMAHFGEPEKQYPLYSDQTIPFWHLQNSPHKKDDEMRMQGLKGLYNVNSETYPQHAVLDANTGQVQIHNQVALHHLPQVVPEHCKPEHTPFASGITVATAIKGEGGGAAMKRSSSSPTGGAVKINTSLKEGLHGKSDDRAIECGDEKMVMGADGLQRKVGKPYREMAVEQEALEADVRKRPAAGGEGNAQAHQKRTKPRPNTLLPWAMNGSNPNGLRYMEQVYHDAKELAKAMPADFLHLDKTS